PGYGQILNQARGEKVEVVLQSSSNAQPGTLTGTILGVEDQEQAVAKDKAVKVEMLNLWCAEGMRSVKLADVGRVRFLNPVMENEVRRALEVLSLSHDTQKKAVSLVFSGEGKRPVKVSYVVENPIWKTSYRLVLGKDGKPFLQGWAVVENPSDEDWNNVRMALISGRPISFQMDLYQPLYVPRPVVEPELFASLRPQTYTDAMDEAPKAVKPMDGPAAMAPARAMTGLESADRDMAETAGRSLQHALRLGRAGGAVPATAGVAGGGAVRAEFGLATNYGAVASAATAANLGDFFQYVI